MGEFDVKYLRKYIYVHFEDEEVEGKYLKVTQDDLRREMVGIQDISDMEMSLFFTKLYLLYLSKKEQGEKASFGQWLRRK